MKVVSMWSGGKDSCYACYKAMKQGYEVVFLLNFISQAGSHSLSHGLPVDIIAEQSRLTGIPMCQKKMPQKSYTAEFKKIIEKLKQEESIEGIVFGDIYLQEHKDWIDNVCSELEVEPILPLWNMDTKKILDEFIEDEFRAVIVSLKAGLLGKEWLGMEIDKSFKDKLTGKIDLCGEKGEFHTLVLSGPMFSKNIVVFADDKSLREDHWYLNITDWSVE